MDETHTPPPPVVPPVESPDVPPVQSPAEPTPDAEERAEEAERGERYDGGPIPEATPDVETEVEPVE